MQLDPLTDNYPFLTPYQYASCDPITNIDIDGLEGGSSVTGVVKDFAYLSSKSEDFIIRPIHRVIVGAASKLPQKLGIAGALIKAALKATYLINTPTLTRNVSESTCQNCGANKDINKPQERIPDEIKACDDCPPIDPNDNTPNLRTPESDPVVKKMIQENIESVENGPYAGIPVFGDLMKAGRYEIQYGYHRQARRAFGHAVKEAAVWYAGGRVFNGAIKFIFRRAPKLITQFATPTIDDAVDLVMKDANKLGHIFDPKHNLGSLVTELGGEENTIRAVLNAANGKLPASGVFNAVPVNVGGQTVYISGNVINGTPRIGTMYIK